MERKVLESVDLEIPKLRSYINLLEQQKGYSQGPIVEELSNVENPDENDENLMIHKLTGRENFHIKSFEALLKAMPKDKINMKNKEGNTPLHVLLQSKLEDKEKAKRLEVLLEAGVNRAIEDKDGTPLELAFQILLSDGENAA